jgi:hypothetical protein
MTEVGAVAVGVLSTIDVPELVFLVVIEAAALTAPVTC